MPSWVSMSVSPTGAGTLSLNELYDWGDVTAMSGNSLTYNRYGDIKTLTATANNGYVFDHWRINGTDYTTISSNITQVESIVAYFIEEGGGTVTQTINLTAGHTYIVQSNSDITSASVENSVLTIANAGKIDVIDLGAGTAGGEPKVLISSTKGTAWGGGNNGTIY